MNSFRLIFHTQNEIPLVHDSGGFASLTLTPSMSVYEKDGSQSVISYKINYRADQNIAKGNVKDWPVFKRGCLYPDETEDLIYFSIYHKANCYFSCRLKLAMSECGCLPWWYLATDTKMAVCGPFGNQCFQQKMIWLKKHLKKVTNSDDGLPPCGCYHNCINTNYWVQSIETGRDSKEWLDVGELAKFDGRATNYEDLIKKVRTSKLEQFLTGYLLEYFNQSSYHRNSLGQSQLPRGEFIPQFEKRSHNLALVYIDSDWIWFRRYNTLVRVSMADMLSAIGGTFGLFTGFSFMIVVDICV